MKILVTGCEGMLGRAVMARLKQRHQLVGIDLADGDLTAEAVVQELMERHAPQWVVHCAAWTNVDGAETDQAAAMAVNAGGTAHLAAACEKSGAGITLISTDYVFNGQAEIGYVEDGQRDPLNYYGQTKAKAEECVSALSSPWQIVRTSWLFGDGEVNFIKTMRRLLGQHETLRVVDDQTGCPTYADDLAGVLDYLVSGRCLGIFHATNQGETTWCELAREVARCLTMDPQRIKACPSSEYPTAAVRPACSVLLSSNLEAVGCPERPRWQDAVADYVKKLENDEVVFP